MMPLKQYLAWAKTDTLVSLGLALAMLIVISAVWLTVRLREIHNIVRREEGVIRHATTLGLDVNKGNQP